MAKKFVERVKHFLHFVQHDLWRIDLSHDTKLSAFGVEVLRVTHLVLKGMKDDNCKLHAAALTYSTLMALVPFLVIIFSISSAIGFTRAKEFLLENAAKTELVQVQEFATSVIAMVERVDVKTLGALGGVIFFYIVFKLLSAIEESFNQIWGVQSSRSVADKVRNYLSVIVIAPTLMLISTAGTPTLLAYLNRMEWLGPVLSVTIRLMPVLLLTIAFIATFMFMPNTQVRFRSAAIGGVVSALLSIILQALMIKAGVGVTRLNTIYGTFAYIPIFLFWMQSGWMILLFGAELAFAIQHRETYAEEQASVRASMVSKLWVAFSVMQEAVRVFQESEASFNTISYARANNIPIRLMHEVVRVLTRERLLGAVISEGQDCFALLQAPEKVTGKKIFDLIISDGASPKELGLHKDAIAEQVLSAIDISLDETLDPITLRKFMENE